MYTNVPPVAPAPAVYKNLESPQLMALLTSIISVSQWMWPGAYFMLHPISSCSVCLLTDQPGFQCQPATAARMNDMGRLWTLYVDPNVIRHLKEWQNSTAAWRKKAGIVVDKKFKF